jgi:hypothetical protein
MGPFEGVWLLLALALFFELLYLGNAVLRPFPQVT